METKKAKEVDQLQTALATKEILKCEIAQRKKTEKHYEMKIERMAGETRRTKGSSLLCSKARQEDFRSERQTL